jgi:hypothetical protein
VTFIYLDLYIYRGGHKVVLLSGASIRKTSALLLPSSPTDSTGAGKQHPIKEILKSAFRVLEDAPHMSRAALTAKGAHTVYRNKRHGNRITIIKLSLRDSTGLVVVKRVQENFIRITPFCTGK